MLEPTVPVNMENHQVKGNLLEKPGKLRSSYGNGKALRIILPSGVSNNIEWSSMLDVGISTKPVKFNFTAWVIFCQIMSLKSL